MPGNISQAWACDFPPCEEISDTEQRCRYCEQYFCAKHIGSSCHNCPVSEHREQAPSWFSECVKNVAFRDSAWTTEVFDKLDALRAQVNDECLIRRATQFNKGISCLIDPHYPAGRNYMGLFHIYLRLVFADGSAWLACLPEPNCPSAGEELTNSILFNECVNLKWLEEIGFPAPRLHAYGFRNDPHNGVGVSFMLISEVPGRPLNEVIATEGELEKVYTQLAELYSKFSQFPFPQIGSLTMDQDGHYKIGPLIGNHRATLSHLGPFENANEYYAAIAKDYQNLIADGQLFVDYPVNAYIIYKHLEELAKHGKLNQFSPDLNDGPFFFQHENHVQNHIFVDERFNITGLVDWSFARIVPIYEAFGPSLVTADDNLIFNGVPRLSEEDRLLAKALYAKCPDLARLSNSPDTVRRFMFGLGHRMGLEFTEALKLFNGILATLDEDIVCDWEEWREVAISRWTNDQRLVALINNSTRDI